MNETSLNCRPPPIPRMIKFIGTVKEKWKRVYAKTLKGIVKEK